MIINIISIIVNIIIKSIGNFIYKSSNKLEPALILLIEGIGWFGGISLFSLLLFILFWDCWGKLIGLIKLLLEDSFLISEKDVSILLFANDKDVSFGDCWLFWKNEFALFSKDDDFWEEELKDNEVLEEGWAEEPKPENEDFCAEEPETEGDDWWADEPKLDDDDCCDVN